jgi:hypothetical protein
LSGRVGSVAAIVVNLLQRPIAGPLLGAAQALSAGSAKALTIQIVVDNEFALFSGTSTSINTLLYQNNCVWLYWQGGLQVIADALASDNIYYLLAMGGGGGAEEVFGTIDIFNLTSASG